MQQRDAIHKPQGPVPFRPRDNSPFTGHLTLVDLLCMGGRLRPTIRPILAHLEEKVNPQS